MSNIFPIRNILQLFFDDAPVLLSSCRLSAVMEELIILDEAQCVFCQGWFFTNSCVWKQVWWGVAYNSLRSAYGIWLWSSWLGTLSIHPHRLRCTFSNGCIFMFDYLPEEVTCDLYFVCERKWLSEFCKFILSKIEVSMLPNHRSTLLTG